MTAFFLIGLDLTARDRIHDRLTGRALWFVMAALISTGSVLTWLINRDSSAIATASLAAFATAGALDAITYQALKKKPRLMRVNLSNTIAAAADSAVFVILAFGWPPMIPVIVGQFIAKTAGGFVWALLLTRKEV